MIKICINSQGLGLRGLFRTTSPGESASRFIRYLDVLLLINCSSAGSDAVRARRRAMEAKRELWHSEIVSFHLFSWMKYQKSGEIFQMKLPIEECKVFIFVQQLSKKVKIILRWVSLQAVSLHGVSFWILTTIFSNIFTFFPTTQSDPNNTCP